MTYEYPTPMSKMPNWGKFSIREPRDPNTKYESLHVINTDDFAAFVVRAFWDSENRQYDQEDLWWRAECLVMYFNMEPPEDTGGIS